ncbi:hypothetical protein PFNF54_03790, partial [Plasmodium falciparum NF54]
RFLNDSMYWRGKVNSCINKSKREKCEEECKKECECFQKWIGKKKEEWDKIKEHFKTQDFGNDALLGPEMKSPSYVLKFVLNIDELFQNIKSGYGNVKELKGINKILDEEKKREEEERADGVVGVASGGDNQNNTTIDKLLDHEDKDATKCKNCQEPTKPASKPEDLARSGASPDTPREDSPPADLDDEEHDEDDEDEDDDAEEEEEEEKKEEEEEHKEEENEAAPEEKKEEGSSSPEEVEEKAKEAPAGPDACNIVQTLFSSIDKFSDACTLKYGKTAPTGWKCVTPSGDKAATSSEGKGSSDGGAKDGVGVNGGALQRNKRDLATPSAKSGDTTGGKDGATGKSDGSICVPPRRRRLYIQKLHDWAEKVGDTATQPQVDTPSQSDKLRDAFIESAAVETFFLWHRYKKIKDKEKLEEQQRQRENGELPGLSSSGDGDSNDPQSKLEKGEIPDGFLRQMFYTLADYKDILYSGSNDNTKSSTYNDIINGDKEIQEREKDIKGAISTYFSNSGTTPTPPVKPSVTTPQTWWELHGPHIWNGMICALTYKENGIDKPEVDTAVRAQLWDSGKNTPQNEKYQYTNVKLEEEASGAKINIPDTSGDNTPTLNTPTLKNFVEIPTFFRWLHEWGSDFCRQRKRMLKNVKHNCRNIERGGHEYCGGDGHDCTRDGIQHNNMLADPDCRDCHIQCRKYRKWIEKKFEEFHNQKNTYGKEKQKLNGNSNDGDNTKFFKEIENRSFDQFLTSLKHCKNNEGDGSDPKNKIDFKEPLKTFGPLEYCKTCPPNKVNCNGPSRRSGGNDQCTAVNGNEWEKIFSENGGNSTTIDVHMIDRRGPYMEKKSQKLENSENPLFKTSRLFKGIREQKWTCKFKDKNTDVCKLDKFDQEVDLNQYTTFKVLLIYWLEDFIEGYYLLKKRKIIEKCTQKGEKTCDDESKNDCACVKKWVEKKTTEWEQIKEHFKNRNQKDGDGNDMKSSVRQLLDPLIYRMDLANGKGKINELKEFLKSYECKCVDNAGNSEKDVVECLLQKLETKAKKCKDPSSGENQKTPCQEYTPPDDDEDLLLEEENTVKAPTFCPKPPKKEEQTEETCDKAADEKVEETVAQNEENNIPPAGPAPPADSPPAGPATDSGKENVVPEPPAPAAPPSPPIPPLATSTLAWSVGIGFAAFTYFYLKVLYIYMYMWGCCVFVWIYIYVYVFSVYVSVSMFGYIYGFTCMCFIYILYIFMYLY